MSCRSTPLFLIFFLFNPGFALNGAINGFVRDRSSGEPLAYANVELKGTGIGTATNQKGYFYLGDVPPGSYTLEVSFIGYQTLQVPVTVSPGKLHTRQLELEPEAVPLGEVKVTAERARFEREVAVSVSRLDTRQLISVPKFAGEVDVFRTVQLLPGVITVSDFSNKLYIRGGSPDQNLILLDGITVYNPAHLFGIFSPFVPEAVSDVTLLAGGFGARYGGRLSSVLDVVTREGNYRRYTGEGSVSMIAAKAIAEGPLPGGSFLIAGRRTYLPDLLLALFGVPGLNYYFYDLMGKANYVPSENSRFTLTGLTAEDILTFWDPDRPEAFKTRLTWGNRGLSLRWNAIFNPILYGEILIAWSNFFSGFRVKFPQTQDLTMQGNLTGWTAKGDFTYYYTDRHTIGFGFDAQLNRMGLDVRFDTIRFNPQDTIIPLAVYLEDRWEIMKDKLFIKPGLRFAYYSSGNRFEPEPRLGVKFRAEKNTALNLALGRFTQPLVTLNSTEPIFAIYDVWVPVPKNRATPTAYHLIAGVERWFTDDISAQLEGYFKDYDNLLETRYGEFFTPADSLLNADGYSLGAELLLRKTAGRFNGWLAYSLMWTRRFIGEEAYYPHYDRRHNINLVINFPGLLAGADLSLRWTLGTGLPYSGVIGYYPREVIRPDGSSRREWGIIYGDRDACRYPIYHRLDAGIARQGKLGRVEVGVFLDVINLYNARNVLLYYWEFTPDGLPRRYQINMIPILPTLGIKVRF